MLIAVGLTLICMAFVVAAAAARLDTLDVIRTGLVSDIKAYDQIGLDLRTGGVPYIDIPVEHLPLSLALIGVLTSISDALGIELWLVWVPAMSMCLLVAAVSIDKVSFAGGNGLRFLLYGAPLFPLVLFRVEPFVVLLAVLGLAALAAGQWRIGAAWTIAGALAKGWPLALATMTWKSGHRILATATVTVTGAILLVVAATPGFQESRSFDGIHSETLLGTILLTWRHLIGAELGTGGSAGAVYVDAAGSALFINALPGLVLAIVWLGIVVRNELTTRQQVAATGLAVLAIMLISPLFSTQFLLWILPFVVFQGRVARCLFAAAAAVGFVTVGFFAPDSAWWAITALVKNVLILALAVTWIRGLVKANLQHRTSRRNLPV